MIKKIILIIIIMNLDEELIIKLTNNYTSIISINEIKNNKKLY